MSQVPKVEKVSPESASVGEQVKIAGENFKLAKTVTFSGVEAQFKTDSDRQITVTVPKIDNPPDSINIKVLNDEKKCSGKGKFKLIASAAPPLSAKTTPVENLTKVSETVPIKMPNTSSSPTPKNPRDLDRSRAEFAWCCVCDVTDVTKESENHRKKYGSLARKMPTLIQVNGLAQTLAFLKAKGKENDHQVQMCKHLSEWICNRFKLDTGDLFSEHILKMDSQRYRLITSESLAFLQWLKRFAEAELGSEEDNQ